MTARTDRWRAASTLGGNDGFGEGTDPLMSSGTARSVQSMEAARSPRSARGVSPRGYCGEGSSSFAPARGAQEVRSFSALVDLRILTADRRDDNVVLYEIHVMAASGARWTVHKRFSDFHAFDAVLTQQILRDALKEWRGLPIDRARALLGSHVDPKSDPTELIPPLPSRMQIGRPSDALIDKRRKQLEIYLQGISSRFRVLEALEFASSDTRSGRRGPLPSVCRPQVIQAVLQHLVLFLQQHSLSSIAQGAVAPMSDTADTARGDTSALFAVFQNEIAQPVVPVIAAASATAVSCSTGAGWSAERPPMRCLHAPGSSYVAMLHLPAVDPNQVLVQLHPSEARTVLVTGSWSTAPLPLELESKLRMLRLLGDSTRGVIVADTLPTGGFRVQVAVPEEFPLESWFTDYTDGVLSVVWSLFQ